VVVVLPFDTMRRILYHVSNPPGRTGDHYADRSSPVSSDTEKLPPLASNIVAGLERANSEKDNWIDGGKHVGHLRRDDFTMLRDWCRAMRLGSDAAAVEAAVTAAPG